MTGIGVVMVTSRCGWVDGAGRVPGVAPGQHAGGEVRTGERPQSFRGLAGSGWGEDPGGNRPTDRHGRALIHAARIRRCSDSPSGGSTSNTTRVFLFFLNISGAETHRVPSRLRP